MCIIAAKFRGLEMPMESRLRSMWECNPDGAGFMVRSNRGIEIFKGYMTFESLMTALDKVDKMVNLKDCDVVLHFRYGTHGGNIPELTHPFTVSKDFDTMKELYNKVDIAVAHNGVYPYMTDYGISDTMMYIKEKIEPLYDKNKKFYETELNKLDGKLCFLTEDGIRFVGKFIEDEYDGIIYSNETYSYYDDYYYDYYEEFDDFEFDYYEDYLGYDTKESDNEFNFGGFSTIGDDRDEKGKKTVS